MKKIILLSGIHGVGKGYITGQLKKEISIPIYEASKLIRLNGVASDRDKIVDNVANNQELLVNSINNLIKEEIFILDGHTCLITADRNIESIDINYFREINIIGIISIYDDINIIKERIYKRDNINFSKSLLDDLQRTEIENTKRLSKQLCTPLLVFKNGDNINRLIDFVKSL